MNRVLEMPLYPILLVASFLTTELIRQWVPVAGLVRPFLALALCVVTVQVLAARFGSKHAGAYFAALILFIALELQTAAYLFAVAAVPLVLISVRARRVAPLDWRRLTALLNVVAAVALAMSVYSAANLGLSVLRGSPEPRGPVVSEGLPDIYLILLDAYPRADTLRSALGFDNTPFLSRMEALGFVVATQAHSNYNRTTLTVPSLLNGRHMWELMPSPPPSIAEQHRVISSLVDAPLAVGEARRLGYEFVAIPSQVEIFSPDTADTYLDSGQLSKFETLLARNGALRLAIEPQLLQWFRAGHRDRVLDAFTNLASLAEARRPGPRLVFAHVMAPHNPIVFGRDGSMAHVPECYWEHCDIPKPIPAHVRSAIVEQVEFVNGEVARTVQRILEASVRPPVIVVFSDHGFLHWQTNGPDTFRSLFVSYTPGRAGVFPDDAAPVNVVARVLNAYASTSIQLADRDVWAAIPPGGDETGYFPLTIWRVEPAP